MDWETYHASLTGEAPPASLPLALQALWQDGKGHWAAAHDLLQADNTPDGSWVHAYLHRKEGDKSNASYWYRKAGKPVPTSPLPAEWEAIARSLLASV